MTKLFSIKSLLIFLLTTFGISSLTAQQLDHRLGVVLVQMEKSTNIDDLIRSSEYFDGLKTSAQPLKLVSKPFNIWSIGFNQNVINEIDFLAFFRRHKLIENAQFDFWNTDRIEPDDPFYFFQYHFNNIGLNGGTPGVDLDAELAWETTTGGVTLNGDTIVLCIIDDNFESSHIDISENAWINYHEIPDNGVDDDGNDYIDDYYGWNVVDSTDDVGNNNNPSPHGTQVAGIAGAVGNNGLGVSGLNWNVKLMFVTRGYSNSDAIAAYTYPFSARKKYNETNGEEGAFVVATNSSWGVNYGTPNAAPLWCAIYDSLGSVGVLSAAATANLAINVDVEGDLPTTCPSDYLVTTTKVDNNDELPANTAYGPLNIDLAAFGKNVFTTSIDDGYASFSGTSAAAPQVAGAIALLYSAPCPSFIGLAKSQPESACLLVKEYLLNGTEDNPNLENITVTGGRLNVANSLQLLMDDCNFSGCYPPYSIEIENITETSATIDFLLGITTTGVSLRFREVGELSWIEENGIPNPFEFTNLQSCTNYEFQLSSNCGPLTSDYSLSYEFQTDGCCNPPSLFEISNIEENQISLSWSEVSAAFAYQIRYREFSSSFWSIISVNDLQATILGFTNCTEYEFQIRSICTGGQISGFSESKFATTLGCSNCLELPYCQSSASEMSFVWIKKVTLANLDHTSGNSYGFGDHTELSVDLLQGQSYELKIKSDSDLDVFPGIFNVWIDFDQNGIFDDFNELILHSSSPEIESTKVIYIPTNAFLGSTRMRVSFLEQNSGSCEQSNFIGEVEDYCVNLEEPSECLSPTNVNFSSNEDSLEVSWFGNLFNESYLFKYKEIIDTVWTYISCPTSQVVIYDLNECTDYEFVIQSICNGEPSFPTELFQFTTKGCGACLDNDYCAVNDADASFEWIERIQLSTLDNSSGSNDGYSYFHDYTTNLEIGNPYPIIITPGFSSFEYNEYYTVWIDLNHDGVFNPDEILYESNVPTNVPAVGIIYIPETAQLGSTRMRIMMNYQMPPDSPCDTDLFGETEEYCINIVENENSVCSEPNELEVGFVSNFTALIQWQGFNNAVSYNLRYQKSDTTDAWEYLSNYNNYCALLQLEECILYQAQVRTVCELGLSEFSEIIEFETSCKVVSSNNIEQKSINAAILFPNPAQDNFYVVFNLNTLSEVSLELFDVSGMLVFVNKMPSAIGDQQIEIPFPENAADGVYYLKMKTKDQSFSVLKVIKSNF